MNHERDIEGSGFAYCGGQKLLLCSTRNLRNIKLGQCTHGIVGPRETGSHLTFNTCSHITECLCPLDINYQPEPESIGQISHVTACCFLTQSWLPGK